MSKIGKISISIPEKVKVVLAGDIINIEGPLGKKSIGIDLEMFNLDIKEGKEISIKPKKIDQDSKRLWGMNRSLINNAVIGSSTGYEKTLELVGVGYRAALKGKQLNLQLGYSHDCLLYTSDAADDSLRVDLGGRRIIKKGTADGADGE